LFHLSAVKERSRNCSEEKHI